MDIVLGLIVSIHGLLLLLPSQFTSNKHVSYLSSPTQEAIHLIPTVIALVRAIPVFAGHRNNHPSIQESCCYATLTISHCWTRQWAFVGSSCTSPHFTLLHLTIKLLTILVAPPPCLVIFTFCRSPKIRLHSHVPCNTPLLEAITHSIVLFVDRLAS